MHGFYGPWDRRFLQASNREELRRQVRRVLIAEEARRRNVHDQWTLAWYALWGAGFSIAAGITAGEWVLLMNLLGSAFCAVMFWRTLKRRESFARHWG